MIGLAYIYAKWLKESEEHEFEIFSIFFKEKRVLSVGKIVLYDSEMKFKLSKFFQLEDNTNSLLKKKRVINSFTRFS